jgi:hypothetical protein
MPCWGGVGGHRGRGGRGGGSWQGVSALHDRAEGCWRGWITYTRTWACLEGIALQKLG